MNVVVGVFPGTNCDNDTIWAFEKIGCKVKTLWHQETALPKNTDLVVLPGGFSYGDYLRSAAIAQFSPIMGEIKKHAKKGGFVLGICNGFQMLLETRMLPGAMKRNESVHFVSKFQKLRVENNSNKFLSKCEVGQILNIPIAHGEGNYFIDQNGLEDLKQNEQILLSYYGENPNGSIANIAGICNKQKNIFGLMPHPERAMEDILGCKDGIKMIEGFLS
ncbi:MAG: phosphoribosylformylglycinamidine synthase I [Proteobacteria bacterium]|nr:MAG: phosphoribosylformylglycinamidine synthase I [Pseudomonadota bacterium]